jgi:hypothetical protein
VAFCRIHDAGPSPKMLETGNHRHLHGDQWPPQLLSSCIYFGACLQRSLDELEEGGEVVEMRAFENVSWNVYQGFLGVVYDIVGEYCTSLN